MSLGGENLPVCFEVAGGNFLPGAGIPPADRGFRFGMHLFETIAVHRGRWLFFREHLRLLRASARQAGFSAADEDLEALEGLPQRAGMVEGLARIYWTAGDGGPADPPSKGRIFVFVEPAALPGLPGQLHIGICPDLFQAADRGWKTGNYWRRCRMLREARERGRDEALVCNPDGMFLGACMANAFFAMADGRILTPPAGDGVRAGIVRAWLMRQMPVEETPFGRELLPHVRSILLTNSRIGLAEAASIEGVALRPFPELGRLVLSYRRRM